MRGERLWRARIAVRRFVLKLIGWELLAYSDQNTRWTISYPADDAESRRVAMQLLGESQQHCGVRSMVGNRYRSGSGREVVDD